MGSSTLWTNWVARGLLEKVTLVDGTVLYANRAQKPFFLQ